MRVNDYMKHLSLILASFLIPAGLVTVSAQTGAAPKPIVDGTGVFGKTLFERLNTDPDGAQKRNIKPFVIGYCGWRTKALVQYPITKFDGLQIGLCRTILQPFDSQLTTTLASLETQTNTVASPIDVSETETKVINEFLVVKHGLQYLGLPDPRLKPDPVAKWKFNLGGNLGEIAAHLTIWWRIWTNPQFEARVGQLIASLNDDIKNAPKNADPKILAALRKLSVFGGKVKFSREDRVRINTLLTETLLASLELSKMANDTASVDAVGGGTQLIGSTPSVRKTAAQYLQDGKALAGKGDYQKAIAEYDLGLKVEPGNGLLYFNRALARERLGQVDEAIRDYDGVILLRVSPREAYFNRGTLLLNKKEYKSAISDFDAAIALDPKYEVAFYNRGLANYSLNNYFAAQADFNNLIKLQPKNANAYIMRSYVYCAQGLRMSAIKDQDIAIGLGGSVERGCK